MRTKSGEVAESAAFVRIRSLFFNTERSTGRLLGLLYRHSAPLGIVHWNTPLISPAFRSCAVYVLGAICLKYLWGKLLKRLRRRAGLVLLPDCGDVAAFCFAGGARLFDLERQRIVNIADGNSDRASKRRERMIAEQRMLGEAGLAPRILRSGGPGTKYVEELCEGAPLSSLAWWEPDVFRRVAAGAERIQKAARPVDRRARVVADELGEAWERFGSFYPRIRESDGYVWLTAEIEELRGRVTEDAPERAFLCHGDLARRNILVRRDGEMVFIDWHTVDHRLTDYDIYNYHFSLIKEGCYEKVSENQVFSYLYEALQRSGNGVPAAQLLNFRLEFFLTRVTYFLLQGPEERSRVIRVMRELKNYAGCFARYEQYCSTAPDSG